ncbi:Gfo/Idh/MocA family oxidoreductase [Flavivirga aquimarina]|uniref:Gfo/Idh/MocA family oxidoreductase n=1 Tax=Flavivirga aquimarina TaxID=2027862 RepID=A0ABT8WE86_9FLAO|nr:Gfo/Idh/MocA family oxidoreductase [Flavivirga aquimarina]MDO5971477.1 Gfo/Idh/MocA family oxidoreductase [Flavivirga aquimarina]
MSTVEKSHSLKLNKIIKWGIIGCGNVTEVKSGPPYKTTTGFELSAVMRRDLDKAKDYAQRHNISKVYNNADELINDGEIDAVYIATPPDTHKFYALKVAAANKPCCIEKPMTPSYSESLAIYQAFKEKKLPLFVAYYRRSLPRFNQIKEWLDNNYIGDVRHINWCLNKPASDLDKSKTYNWRTDAKIAPGGYFDDLASHGLDLFTYLLGNIKEAHGISDNQQRLYTAKDAVTACWVHENGTTGSGNWNFGCDAHTDKVQIFGSNGSIQFSIFHDNPIILNSDTKSEELFIENPKHIQSYHIEGMRDMLINKNYIHPSLGESALHTNWIMDKILGKL